MIWHRFLMLAGMLDPAMIAALAFGVAMALAPLGAEGVGVRHD